ncbi:c-type cytochrome [Aestuariivirga sp.]|uniref:c-type cytochrome n=1 Tax=Aestuariivirga sp. TaxID=2650926 RepID=UPI0025BF2812|nr:c-type cytochrome [Aestuariivirga sp.]MCA3555574.1 c-type cytochrome [Aestuariivirga sp.]
MSRPAPGIGAILPDDAEERIMKREYLVLALAVTGLTAAGAHGAAAGGSVTGAPLVSEGISLGLGHRDYLNYCAACHGADARGDGTLGEFLTLKAPDLTMLSKLNAGKFPEERVTEVIDGRADVKVHGMRDMPVWGDWFNREAAGADTGKAARELIVSDRIASLIVYLESIQAK